MERVKQYAVLLSGILGFLVPTYFGYTLYVNKLPQNIATWGMVFALDAFGLLFAVKDGNKKPYLQIGWTIAAGLIFFGAFFGESTATWGRTEMISIVLCSLTVVLWRTLGPRAALIAYMVAMWVSFVPLAKDYLSQPQPTTAWLWYWTIISCVLALWGAEKRDFTNTFVPWGCIGLNLIMWYLAVR